MDRHRHYFRTLPSRVIDLYRFFVAFGVTDPCVQHAVKKLVAAGERGAGKSADQDVQEAIDTMTRWQEMRAEERAATCKDVRCGTQGADWPRRVYYCSARCEQACSEKGGDGEH